MSTPPPGFNPDTSLLQQNSAAPIVPFRGGGKPLSLEPFYQAILKKLPQEKRKTLPKTITDITKFAISVEDGKFVLKLKVKGIKKTAAEIEEEEKAIAELEGKNKDAIDTLKIAEAKKKAEEDDILKKAKEFLILEAARAFLLKLGSNPLPSSLSQPGPPSNNNAGLKEALYKAAADTGVTYKEAQKVLDNVNKLATNMRKIIEKNSKEDNKITAILNEINVNFEAIEEANTLAQSQIVSYIKNPTKDQLQISTDAAKEASKTATDNLEIIRQNLIEWARQRANKYAEDAEEAATKAKAALANATLDVTPFNNTDTSEALDEAETAAKAARDEADKARQSANTFTINVATIDDADDLANNAMVAMYQAIEEKEKTLDAITRAAGTRQRKKLANNAAAKKLANNAAAKKKAEADAAAKKLANNAAAAKVKAEEEAAAKKLANNAAAAKVKAEEEAAAKKKANNEAAAKVKAEEEEKKKAAQAIKSKLESIKLRIQALGPSRLTYGTPNAKRALNSIKNYSKTINTISNDSRKKELQDLYNEVKLRLNALQSP